MRGTEKDKGDGWKGLKEQEFRQMKKVEKSWVKEDNDVRFVPRTMKTAAVVHDLKRSSLWCQLVKKL